jgi:hypothetical protein
MYPAMFLGGYRLVAQDLQQGHTGALFLSLLLYGAALTALPRVKEAPISSRQDRRRPGD